MMYLLLLLINPVLSLSYEKARLYDAIDCNMISRLHNTTIISNDYVLLTKADEYIFIDKNLYNINNMYNNNSDCYQKKELTLHYDCDKYTKFSFYSTVNTINNFIENLNNITEFNISNTVLYINNYPNKCMYNNKEPEFYGLYFLLFLWLIIFKAC